MNQSIIATWKSEDREVSFNAEKLLARAFSDVRVTFRKKDGSIRVMVVRPRREWNADVAHKETTEVGRRIVASKVAKGMVTVVEVCPPDETHVEERLQPRTINLAAIIAMEELSKENS